MPMLWGGQEGFVMAPLVLREGFIFSFVIQWLFFSLKEERARYWGRALGEKLVATAKHKLSADR